MIEVPLTERIATSASAGTGRLAGAARLLCLAFAVAAPALAHADASRTSAPAWEQSESMALRQMESEAPDWALVRAELERAVALGSVRAKSYLGWIHENGHGVAADPVKAAHWYAEVADAGVPEFALKLGWMYMGAAVGPDRDQAERWFHQAIDSGHLPANVALASVLIADALGGARYGARIRGA